MSHFKIINPDYITAEHLFITNYRHTPRDGTREDAVQVQQGGACEGGNVVRLTLIHGSTRGQVEMDSPTAVALALALLRNAGEVVDPDVLASINLANALRVEDEQSAREEAADKAQRRAKGAGMSARKEVKRPRGRPPIDNPASARVAFRVRPDQLEAYTRAASKAGVSLSAWCERLLDGAAARSAAR